jgi:REP element-mobilizing transposase RayT
MPDIYTQLYVHLVWATWDRVPYLTGETQAAAYACIRADCHKLGVDVLEIGGMPEHLHILTRLPTTVAIAALVKQAKGASAHLANHLPSGESFVKWQKGYGAFTISKQQVERVREYIRRQEEHHSDGTLLRDLELTAEER